MPMVEADSVIDTECGKRLRVTAESRARLQCAAIP